MTRFGRIGKGVMAVVAGALAASVLGGLPPRESSAQAPVSWKFFIYNPAPHPFAKALQQWADEVKARTQGRMDIKVFPAGELPYRVNQATSIVGNRLVEMADTNGTFIEGEVPIASLNEMPYRQAAHAVAVAVEQLGAQPALERLDAAADRGLLGIQLRGGGAEAAGFCNGEEKTHVVPIAKNVWDLILSRGSRDHRNNRYNKVGGAKFTLTMATWFILHH